MPMINGVGKALKTVGDFTAFSASVLGALSGGASIKEAIDAGSTIPNQVKEDQRLALAKIQGRPPQKNT